MIAINEIFYSVQGEGRWAGTPMVFVRTAGCNLRCPWCDQPDTIAEDFTDRTGTKWKLDYTKKSEEDILSEVRKYPTKHVCLTGGEPTTHKLYDLVSILSANGKYIHMETNGVLAPKWYPLVHHVTLSPKREELPCIEAIRQANDLKFIVDERFVIREAESIREMPEFQGQAFLQPCNNRQTWDPKMLEKTLELVKQHSQYRLSLQLHKILGVR